MKIVKSVLAGVLVITCLSLFSCNSTKKAAKANKKNADLEAPLEGEAAEESVEGEENAENNAETENGEVNAEDGEVSTEEGDSDSVNTENINKINEEWADVPSKDIDLKVGSLRIRTKTKLGSYNISVLTENGKYVPVLSTANEYTSSYYSLKVDKKIYKLIADGNTKTKAKKNDSEKGISMLYTIKNVASIQVDYDIFSSSEKIDEDMIKVTATVINEGSKKSEFSLKTILDTILGESTETHFFTSEKVPIKNEVMYRTMQNEKWFLSKNNKAKMQIMLYGSDISKIDTVALANYGTLDIKAWEPDMLSYRAFDTVLSYNNSAVGISWPTEKLGVGEKVSYVFYLAFAADIEDVKGDVYICPEKVDENLEVQTKEFTSSLIDGSVIVEKTVTVPVTDSVDTPLVQELTKISATPDSPVQNGTNSVSTPEVQFDVSKVTKEQLSPEYIQDLLNRIAALEENDTSVNREEILKLNAELDVILEILRQ